MARFGEMFKASDVKKAEPHPRRETKWIHYTKLTDNRKQYRKSTGEEDIEALAMLIEADKGVLQNLLIRKIDTDEYEIIAGHHRKKACQYLVEKKGLKEYEFLPCMIENMDDVRAEFQLYSSNGFVPKDDYEKMHELERMRYLLETYPEEFPHLQTGRMVERLARQMNMNKTTVGEYLSISKNLGEKGMEAFREGNLNKSAALAMSGLPEEEQEQLIGQGVIKQKDIVAYKEKKNPSDSITRDNPEAGSAELEGGDSDASLPGQLCVANIDMELQEEVADSGTQDKDALSAEENPEQDKEEYSPEYFLAEQKDKWEMMIKSMDSGEVIPRIVQERQKTIVIALSRLVKEM